MRCVCAGKIEFGFDGGMAKGDGPGRRKNNFLPQTHVFIRRRGVPIDPGDTELGGMRWSDRDGHYVFSADLNEIGDIKFVTAESAGDRVRAREFFAIDPDI